MDTRREYSPTPLVGVGAIVIIDNKILLVKRRNPPCKGCWSIPGGLLKVDENAKEAVLRELYEETGIKGKVKSLLDTFEIIIKDSVGLVKYHYVILDFLVEPNSMDIRPGDDAVKASFFSIEDAFGLNLTRSTRILLERLKKLEKGEIIECSLYTIDATE